MAVGFTIVGGELVSLVQLKGKYFLEYLGIGWRITLVYFLQK
jgi:hypothetical protein